MAKKKPCLKQKLREAETIVETQPARSAAAAPAIAYTKCRKVQPEHHTNLENIAVAGPNHH